jgi:hypothetical protein
MLFNRNEMNDFKETVHYKQNTVNGLWYAFYQRPGTDDLPSFICRGTSKEEAKKKAMLKIHKIYLKAQELELAAKKELSTEKIDFDPKEADFEE